jgi:hypothetical protein
VEDGKAAHCCSKSMDSVVRTPSGSMASSLTVNRPVSLVHEMLEWRT